MYKEKELCFHKSMVVTNNEFLKNWTLLEDLYIKNFIKNTKKSEEPIIPKIIHQIWIGSYLPEQYLEFSKTWQEKHPDWEYKLWTDKEIENENLINRKLYNRVENLGAKADILRCEILFKYGGVYADTDFICLKPFDDLVNRLDFICGIHDHFKFVIPNSIIGGRKEHPIFNEAIKLMKEVNVDNNLMKDNNYLMNTIGPGLLTKAIMKILNDDNLCGKSVVFPSTYFYPAPASVRNEGVEYMKKYIKDESYAVHLWEVSWTKKKKKSLFKRALKKILNKL